MNCDCGGKGWTQDTYGWYPCCDGIEPVEEVEDEDSAYC